MVRKYPSIWKTYSRKTLKKIVIGCMTAMICLTCWGCQTNHDGSEGTDAVSVSSEDGETSELSSRVDDEINSLDDLKDMEAVIASPSDYDISAELSEICPSYEHVYYDDFMTAIEALKSGKYDAIATGEEYIKNLMDSGSGAGLKMLDEPVKIYYCALGLSNSVPVDNYVSRVNEALAQLASDGTIDDMKRRWFEEGDYVMPEIEFPENPDYTLRVVTFGLSKPYSFMSNNELTGIDVELAYRVAAYLNCDVELTRTEYASMLLGLATGKYDMISANLYIQEGREENITYSDSFDQANVCMMVRSNEEKGVFTKTIESLKEGFNRTFIEEDRWKLILNGLKITVLITILGFALANLLGAVFCYFAMSKSRFLRGVEDVFVRIMQGTPMVVILLILFYIIFASSPISGTWVAIIGFGMTSGASLSRQFRGAIASVPRTQNEAALALGLTKFQAFTGITMPQAIRRLLSGYFSEIIGLFKGTSIVGYVAVIDLTKASDLIRSSTYDAFFPLISVAVIYFLISCLLLSVLKKIQKNLEPERGVVQNDEK